MIASGDEHDRWFRADQNGRLHPDAVCRHIAVDELLAAGVHDGTGSAVSA